MTGAWGFALRVFLTSISYLRKDYCRVMLMSRVSWLCSTDTTITIWKRTIATFTQIALMRVDRGSGTGGVTSGRGGVKPRPERYLCPVSPT